MPQNYNVLVLIVCIVVLYFFIFIDYEKKYHIDEK